MKEKLEACFERLQRLNIVPTLENMEILVQTLYDLRDVYNQIGKGETDGGPEADPEKRDDH